MELVQTGQARRSWTLVDDGGAAALVAPLPGTTWKDLVTPRGGWPSSSITSEDEASISVEKGGRSRHFFSRALRRIERRGHRGEIDVTTR